MRELMCTAAHILSRVLGAVGRLHAAPEQDRALRRFRRMRRPAKPGAREVIRARNQMAAGNLVDMIWKRSATPEEAEQASKLWRPGKLRNRLNRDNLGPGAGAKLRGASLGCVKLANERVPAELGSAP